MPVAALLAARLAVLLTLLLPLLWQMRALAVFP
jgi:hypothetical protein